MSDSRHTAALKFDQTRASEYEERSRIALAGYGACHVLTACMLTAALGAGKPAEVLIAGAGGTAQEIFTLGNVEPLPLLLAAWRQRWRMAGTPTGEIDAKLQTILRGADPPASGASVADLLGRAGFQPPLRFFSSLFWGAWLTRSSN